MATNEDARDELREIEAVIDSQAGRAGVAPETLLAIMQSVDVAPRLRRKAGLLLGRLGWQPDDLDEFVEIPAGEFLYGERRRKKKIEQPFAIAKYPLTNAQYRRFINADGYNRRELWSDKGWVWREKEERNRPYHWHTAKWNNPISPLVGVSWYEAEAYCNWLAKTSGKPVRLPTEQQWARAARGTDGREYPWGDGFDPIYANTEASGEIGTTAVCTYPAGVSPAGVWDMSGNVWEWTQSLWSPEISLHVLRGGSWFNPQRNCRCAYRSGNVPVNSNNTTGFRVLVSPA